MVHLNVGSLYTTLSMTTPCTRLLLQRLEKLLQRVAGLGLGLRLLLPLLLLQQRLEPRRLAALARLGRCGGWCRCRRRPCWCRCCRCREGHGGSSGCRRRWPGRRGLGLGRAVRPQELGRGLARQAGVELRRRHAHRRDREGGVSTRGCRCRRRCCVHAVRGTYYHVGHGGTLPLGRRRCRRRRRNVHTVDGAVPSGRPPAYAAAGGLQPHAAVHAGHEVRATGRTERPSGPRVIWWPRHTAVTGRWARARSAAGGGRENRTGGSPPYRRRWRPPLPETPTCARPPPSSTASPCGVSPAPGPRSMAAHAACPTYESVAASSGAGPANAVVAAHRCRSWAAASASKAAAMVVPTPPSLGSRPRRLRLLPPSDQVTSEVARFYSRPRADLEGSYGRTL